MSETYVTLWGNIATDPKSLTTTGGVRMTKFRLACTASRRDAQTGEFADGVTSWYSVACWRDLAVNVAASLTKGDPVVVYGKQVVRDWEADDGRKGTEVSIDALSVGHDLRRGQARFNRIRRDQAALTTTESEGTAEGVDDELAGHRAAAAAPLTALVEAGSADLERSAS
jgi:single-strand DNA-binding protein